MNLIEAVKEMNEGKYCYNSGLKYKINSYGTLCVEDTSHNWVPSTMTLSALTRAIWTLYEEPKKTLFERIKSQSNECNPISLYKKDDRSVDAVIKKIREEHDMGMTRAVEEFKKSLKKFINAINIMDGHPVWCKNKAKEIFGKELIE